MPLYALIRNARPTELQISDVMVQSIAGAYAQRSHRPSSFSLHYLRRGRMTVRSAGVEVSATRDDVLVLFPDRRYAVKIARDTRLVHCHFSFGPDSALTLVEVEREAAAAIACTTGRDGDGVLLLAEHWSGTVPRDLIADLVAASRGRRLDRRRTALLRLMGIMTGADTEVAIDAGSQLVRQARSDIARRFMHPISVHDIAHTLGVTPDHLGRIFLRASGMTVGAWIRHQRLARARALLLGTQLTVKRIAAAVGYPDALYFSRIFQCDVGAAPTSWRAGRGATSSVRPSSRRTDRLRSRP